MMLLAADTHGEGVAFLVIGVLGLIFSATVFLAPGMFDAATRMRLRWQGDREDDDGVLERDRQRRKFIALVLAVGSAAILANALSRL